MTCKEIEDLLPGMIDGALPETEKKRIEAHLETCATCRKAFADLRTSDEQVKSLEEVEPPPWLKTRVMARVREEAEQKEGIFRKLFYPLHVKVPIQALATVLIAVVAWNVYKTGEPEFRQMAPPPAAVQEAPKAQAPPEPGPAEGPAKKDESPATREKKSFAPPPAQVKEPVPQRAATVREETMADAEKPVDRLRDAKRPAEPPKDEGAWRGTGAARPGEAGRALEAPAQAQDQQQKLKATKAPVGAVAKEAGKQEARPAASPMMSAAVTPRPDLEATLRVRAPEAAASEVETILKQASAQAVERQAREGRVILTARIQTEHLEALRERLKSLGPVQESVHVAPRPGASLTIRIEILPD
jgi:anti-sigma factor RsiW